MDWNARYQEGDTPWEKGSFAPPLEEIKSRCGSSVWGEGTVLVPGCGFGHDARWIASQRDHLVQGLDISLLAIEGAQERAEGGNLRFESGDFFAAKESACSAIFEHTCFCAIDLSQRQSYVRAAATWLPSGGHLVAIFFLNPDHDKGPPFGCTLEELDGLFGRDFELIDEWEPQVGYPGRVGREWIRILKKR